MVPGTRIGIRRGHTMPSALLEIIPGVQVGANHITTSGAAVVEEIEPLPRGGVPVPVLGRVPRKLHPL